jgi:predicted TIM-barrel fold metal-dependent hydrolase
MDRLWFVLVVCVTLTAASIGCRTDNSARSTRPVTSAGPVDSSPPVASSAPAAASSSPAAWRTWDPKTPIIDSHVHIIPTKAGLSRALEVFDQVGVGQFAVKSAGYVGSPKYEATLAMSHAVGDRMRAFANIDWRGVNDPNFAKKQVKLLEQAKRDGIVGIKIFKALGLAVRDKKGKLIPIDAPRLRPIFDACGRLGLIVAWHVADPVAFFKPVTPDNERYDELKMAPDWSFYGKDYPSHDALLAARDRVIRRHPKTVFLLIHLANYPESIDFVSKLLDANPNVYVDTSARVPEIGRHDADKVRAFFIKHQDRIMFGSDFIAGPTGSMQLGSVSEHEPTVADALTFYERHWRFFETTERQIAHPTPSQGRWKVDAIGLPMDVLRKLYVTNAQSLIFSGQPPVPYRKAP